MKVKLLIVSLVTTFAAFSQPEIKIADVKAHVGDSVKVCAIVRNIKYLQKVKGQPTFLDYGGTYPNAPLTLVIWGERRSQFPDIDLYKGSNVCLTGKIVLYRDKPEIVLYSRQQIISVVKDEEVIKK